jgi:hypothetical protein
VRVKVGAREPRAVEDRFVLVDPAARAVSRRTQDNYLRGRNPKLRDLDKRLSKLDREKAKPKKPR